MAKHTISLAKLYNPDDFYRELERYIELPPYFGYNLDALHDVFTDIGRDTEITFTDTAEAEVMMSKYMRNLKRMCENCCKENPKLKITFE
jgi:ribonuclease inhibitor